MKYLSLFSGIGGFELGIQQVYELQKMGTEPKDSTDIESAASQHSERPFCIGYSEIDKYAIQIYEKHFKHKNYGDITKIIASELPDFDLLVGGFPCQSFSIAGKRRGFNDTRGTLFFDIARILKEKRPRLLLLENVKGLLSHDNGRTFKTIISTLDELGYDLQWQVLNSKNFGVPQNRERVFIIGNLRGTKRPNIFPLEKHGHTNIEKVYLLQGGVPSFIQSLFSRIPFQEKEEIPGQQMQELLQEVSKGIQEKQCREVQNETENLDADPKGSIQIIEELNSWTQSVDKSGGICGLVQIPTEEVLLLWSNGKSPSISFGQIQQQDLSFECGQSRLLKGIREGELSALLLAVQSYQGRLFYSIGNGRDWQKIYSKTLEKWNTTLSSILEEHPDQKYFLSEKKAKYLTTALM